MAMIEVVDLPEQEGELNGRYPLVIDKVGVSQSGGGFWCMAKITKGVDRKGIDAANRSILFNITTDFSKVDPQWQKMHSRKFYNFMEVMGVDPHSSFDVDDFVGKELEGAVKTYIKKDGTTAEDITKFFKVS